MADARTMHLVELLLPVYDRAGTRFPQSLFDLTAGELTRRFGGLTAHVRAPAAGLWQEEPGRTQRDDIVIYEVMVEGLEPGWWAAYRRSLEQRFAQEELVVRAQEIRRL
jgi:hypothetical protein